METPPRSRILVVDDHPENRALAQATLEDEGYEVLLASTGEEAIAIFQQERPDCILLDVRMPGTDGLTVCSKIRSVPEGVDVPIIFLTAMRDLDTFDRALHAGANDFLTKPVRPSELVVRVQSALRLSRMTVELRDHFATICRQRNDLVRLQLQKERLMAFVVHDLKNPINHMDLHAQLLLRNRDLPQRAREGIAHIRDEARSLLRLVLNLLDISKCEEGELTANRTQVDLAAMVDEIIEAYEIEAHAREVTLHRDLQEKTVWADPDLLRRVLGNLIDNALRHAPEQSEVRLTSTRDRDALEICVADRGQGVPAELHEKIFERYVQVENENQNISRTGRGLGLTFCRFAMAAHGGSIVIEDGQPGAIFRLRIPYVR